MLTQAGFSCAELQELYTEAAGCDETLVELKRHDPTWVFFHVQTLQELHTEAAGRNEVLVALESLTKESAAKQARLVEAMQACQHLQSELEASQVG